MSNPRPASPSELARRARALRATRVVTFGSLALAACGTSPESGSRDVGADGTTDATGDVGTDIRPDTPPDSAPDVPLDTTPDVFIDADRDTEFDASPTCSDTADGVCPDGCTGDDDFDCCDLLNDGEWSWCDYSPEWGCQCAVEGPFAPPRFAA